MAQADTTPVYLRFPTVPVFTLTKLSDSSRFTRDDLSKNKATIFIIFNPFCDHCKNGTKELTANMELFKKAQIVMASSIEHSYLKAFYEEYKIADHPAIIMGRDPSNYLGTFFRIQNLPSIYVYDKKGNFIKAFEGPAPVEKIAEIL